MKHLVLLVSQTKVEASSLGDAEVIEGIVEDSLRGRGERESDREREGGGGGGEDKTIEKSARCSLKNSFCCHEFRFGLK